MTKRRRASPDQKYTSAASTCVTAFQSSQKVGVYGYMPPEVHRKKPYGFAVDVFAMGVVLRRTLCCAAPPIATPEKVRARQRPAQRASVYSQQF